MLRGHANAAVLMEEAASLVAALERLHWRVDYQVHFGALWFGEWLTFTSR